MNNTQVFRPKSNLVWAGLAFILDALFVFQSFAYPTTGNLIVDLLVAALIAALAYLLWIKPKLILRELDLVVVNPIKTTVVAYAAITDLKTKWTLTIEHGDSKVEVWVAPANGKSRWIADSTFRWRNNRVPLSDSKTIEHTSMSQSTKSDSGLAASLIRERMNRH